MEDPYSAMEGSIQEYSPEENRSRMRWILNKGLTVGKKILVTGFVVSSVPVVVPPLVVISFLGFACSVPYGLLLASYACTDKLMSMLLPGSKPPPFLLDYGKVLCTDEIVEDDEYCEGEDVWPKGGIDMEKEEEEMEEDMRETVEMRIELVENDNDHYFDEVECGGVGKDENEIVEENGYEEDVDEYEDENEEEPAKFEVELRIEGVGEEDEEEPVVDDLAVVNIGGDEKSGGTIEDVAAPFEVTDIVVEVCQNNEINEDDELVKETTGLLEKIREEGMTDNEEKNRQSVEKLSGEAEEGHGQVNMNVQEMGIPMEGRIDNKPLPEVEKNNNDIPKERSKVQDIHNILEAEKPIGEMTGVTDVGSIKEEQKPVLNKPFMLEQDIQLKREKENVISSNADAREIADESGLDLFDGKNAAAHTYTDYNAGGGPATVDYMALPVFSGERKCNVAGIRSHEDSGMAAMASIKEVYSEEKIWEQIDAMRRIVGYKAAAQGTCIEELKALYLFTGVEPPALFKDPSDLVEVNEKLRFLMSIVGVK